MPQRDFKFSAFREKVLTAAAPLLSKIKLLVSTRSEKDTDHFHTLPRRNDNHLCQQRVTSRTKSESILFGSDFLCTSLDSYLVKYLTPEALKGQILTPYLLLEYDALVLYTSSPKKGKRINLRYEFIKLRG